MIDSLDSRFAPSTDTDERGPPVPLFVDTNALFAYFYRPSSQHDEVRTVIRAIGAGDLPYNPLLTNQYVLDEVVTLLLSRADTRAAHEALGSILDEPTFEVLGVEPQLVERAVGRFRRYDDQTISLTDHMIAVQADERLVDHLFTYDGDFRTVGVTVVPRDA